MVLGAASIKRHKVCVVPQFQNCEHMCCQSIRRARSETVEVALSNTCAHVLARARETRVTRWRKTSLAAMPRRPPSSLRGIKMRRAKASPTSCLQAHLSFLSRQLPKVPLLTPRRASCKAANCSWSERRGRSQFLGTAGRVRQRTPCVSCWPVPALRQLGLHNSVSKGNSVSRSNFGVSGISASLRNAVSDNASMQFYQFGFGFTSFQPPPPSSSCPLPRAPCICLHKCTYMYICIYIHTHTISQPHKKKIPQKIRIIKQPAKRNL